MFNVSFMEKVNNFNKLDHLKFKRIIDDKTFRESLETKDLFIFFDQIYTILENSLYQNGVSSDKKLKKSHDLFWSLSVVFALIVENSDLLVRSAYIYKLRKIFKHLVSIDPFNIIDKYDYPDENYTEIPYFSLLDKFVKSFVLINESKYSSLNEIIHNKFLIDKNTLEVLNYIGDENLRNFLDKVKNYRVLNRYLSCEIFCQLDLYEHKYIFKTLEPVIDDYKALDGYLDEFIIMRFSFIEDLTIKYLKKLIFSELNKFEYFLYKNIRSKDPWEHKRNQKKGLNDVHCFNKGIFDDLLQDYYEIINIKKSNLIKKMFKNSKYDKSKTNFECAVEISMLITKINVFNDNWDFSHITHDNSFSSASPYEACKEIKELVSKYIKNTKEIYPFLEFYKKWKIIDRCAESVSEYPDAYKHEIINAERFLKVITKNLEIKNKQTHWFISNAAEILPCMRGFFTYRPLNYYAQEIHKIGLMNGNNS